MSDWQLLRDYVEKASDSAILELIHRYLDLVYSSAVRRLENPQAAVEVSKSVFQLLFTKAPFLQKQKSIAGWLHQSIGFQTIKYWRTKERPFSRNPFPAVSWRMLAPVLDEALDHLNDTDRQIILLTMFLKKPASEIAEIFEIRLDAAQLRVSRAIERLCEQLSNFSIKASKDELLQLITENSIQSAPESLSDAIYHSIRKNEKLEPQAFPKTPFFSPLKMRIALGTALAMFLAFISLEVIRYHTFRFKNVSANEDRRSSFIVDKQLNSKLLQSRLASSENSEPPVSEKVSTVSKSILSVQIYFEAKLIEVIEPNSIALAASADSNLSVDNQTVEEFFDIGLFEDGNFELEQFNDPIDLTINAFPTPTEIRFDPESLNLPKAGEFKVISSLQNKSLLETLEHNYQVKTYSLFAMAITNGQPTHIYLAKNPDDHTSKPNLDAEIVKLKEPVWTVVPTIMADGHTLHLSVNPSDDSSRQPAALLNTDQGPFSQPSALLGTFEDSLQRPESNGFLRILVWDGQTVIFNLVTVNSEDHSHRFLFITSKIGDMDQHSVTAEK